MKSYIIYVCEQCGKESRNRDEINQCEANHLGLTLKEFNIYKQIQKEVHQASSRVNTTKNEYTEKCYEDAINKLIDFEHKHNIKEEDIYGYLFN